MDVCYARVAGFLSAEHRRKDYEFANYINYINYNTNKQEIKKKKRCSLFEQKNYTELQKGAILKYSTTMVEIVVFQSVER